MKTAVIGVILAAVLSLVVDGWVMSIILRWFEHPVSVFQGIVIASFLRGLVSKREFGSAKRG